MGTHDNALRKTAIPYYANAFGYNRTTSSDQDIGSGSSGNDDIGTYFQPTYGTPGTINPIRFLQPYYGDIIEANLNLAFQLASAESARQLRLAIGTFQSDGITPTTSYTDSYINASHQLITGLTAPFSISAAGSFSQNKLNLFPALYKRGSANFVEDLFVLLLVFDSAPSVGSGWAFTKCEINCTAQMGLQ